MPFPMTTLSKNDGRGDGKQEKFYMALVEYTHLGELTPPSKIFYFYFLPHLSMWNILHKSLSDDYTLLKRF